MIEIEKDIPLPTPRRQNRRYPFRHMEVGDSVFFPGENTRGRAATAARAIGYRHSKRFAARTMMKKGDVGVRIWRVE